ncbi:hypothetical protein [Chrysiogenes arsenatis]|uniref:hypothetical protein n=1 Tax=Chrysiogenes arsenatis TaxID=309797 RepID=UPI0003F99400|nr:hypothetical protein [Chrysiogenes arsenatis]
MSNHSNKLLTLDVYYQIAHWLGSRVVGWERSLQITPNGFDGSRLLFGFDKQNLDPMELFSHFQEIGGVPNIVSESILADWDRANFCYLAIESAVVSPENVSSATPEVIKLYLEFPVHLSTQVGEQLYWQPSALWCRGYKWRARSGKLERVTSYHMVPGATIATIPLLLPEVVTEPIFGSLLDRIGVATVDGEKKLDILYVNTPPQSQGVDLRVYDLNVAIRDILPCVQDQCFEILSISRRASVIQILSRFPDAMLGHISLGWRRPNEPYLTFYWEWDKEISLRE